MNETESVDSDEQAAEWLRAALGLGTSHSPFPWQLNLLKRFRLGEVVPSIDIPTGLGKTAVMAVWLVARAHGASLPRRLVYVVDRRAVVDQATEVAESLRAWVAKERAVAEALGLGARPLPISTLRGQHVDNRAWLEDPSAPAIVVGTIDMVGSRLLFSGYGVSSKMRPHHAGLLGADTLVVLDEAHLVPAFEDLLRQVERGADSFGPKEPSLRRLVPEFKLVSLSATGHQTDFTPLTLDDSDRKHPILSKRLSAKKSLTIVELASAASAAEVPDATSEASGNADAEEKKASKGPKLASVLAKQAWELTAQGSAKVRCLVFCNSRTDATTAAAELRNLAKSASEPEPTIELFVGGRRVKERAMVARWLVEHGFVEREDGTRADPQGPTFLVATSAGEVGVDMDADHMVCDLVAWERMVQRLGRVNRRGDGDAKVIVVVESEPTPSDGMKKALDKREASKAANKQLDELTQKLSALQDEKTNVPKGQKKSSEAKATEEKRKQAEKDLKKSISACQKRTKAFKDADAKVAARHEADIAQHRALRKLLQAVQGEGGSLSPNALLQLRKREDDTLCAATTTKPVRPELTRPLVDAWSMTSLEEHPGRPEVDPWLRGFRPNDPPQTIVVWRRHLPVRADGSFDAKAAKRFFDAAPPHTSEQLETETHLVRGWLIDRATAVSETKAMLDAKQVVAVAIGARGELKGWCTLHQLAAAKSKGKDESKDAKKARDQSVKQLEELLIGATLVVDSRLGGLTDGLLSAIDDPSLAEAKRAADKVADTATKAADKAKEKASKAEEAASNAEAKLAVTREAASAPTAKKKAQDAVIKAEAKARAAREVAERERAAAATAEAARTSAEAAKESAERALARSSLAEAADDENIHWLERADVTGVPVTGFRIRALGTGEEVEAARRTTPGSGWVRRNLFVTNAVDGEPSAALVVDGWVGDAATEEERAESDREQQLDEHESWAAECARSIGKRFGLEKKYEDLLALAAHLHDEGKRAPRWQRAFKAPIGGRPYAKTKGPIDFDILDGYRHELGSLSYVEQHEEFLELDADGRDFVLHLIAAHHGFSRPVISTRGCDDAPPSIVDERAREVALRFARLSRRWGPWGLAWWESLLRAADQIASRRNQQAASAQEEK